MGGRLYRITYREAGSDGDWRPAPNPIVRAELADYLAEQVERWNAGATAVEYRLEVADEPVWEPAHPDNEETTDERP